MRIALSLFLLGLFGCAKPAQRVSDSEAVAAANAAVEKVPIIGKYQMAINTDGRVVRMNTMTGKVDVYLIDAVAGGHWVELRDMQPITAPSGLHP